MLFFEKNIMPFNLKKSSADSVPLNHPVKTDIIRKLENPDFITKLFENASQQIENFSIETSQLEKKIIFQTWADIVADKTTYVVKELKRKKVPIDKPKNYKGKCLGRNKYYLKGTSLLFLDDEDEDKKIQKFKETTKNLISGNYKQSYFDLPYPSLDLKESSGLKDETAHFDKQQDKCYYCGRNLYSGKFNQGDIHLEHLIDKSNWINQIILGEELMMKFFDTPIEAMPNYSKAKEDAGYIKAIIQSNAVNSLQNWMYADAECNMSKMDLTNYDFIYFMEQIQNVNTPEIINRNKAVYENFSTNNQNYKKLNAKDFIASGNSKSYEIYHEYLSSIIENNTPNMPEELLSKLYLTAGTSPSRILSKIDDLLTILNQPEYKQSIDNESFVSRKNSFDSLIRDKKASDFKDKKTLFATKEDCLCSICGKKNSEPSPLNRTSTSTVFDITESLDDFQWQLVHTDCAARCNNLSVRTLRFLAQQIARYKPEREKVTASLGPNIENIYKTFVKHLEDLQNQLSATPIMQVAFNLAKFIRRGGR
jgi:hypothetical protein